MQHAIRPLFTPRTLAWRVILSCLLLAFFARALVPAGYMPAVATGGGDFAVRMAVCGDGGSHAAAAGLGESTHAPGDSTTGMHCPFAVLASQAMLASEPGLRVEPSVQTPEPAPRSAHRIPRTLPSPVPSLGARAPPALAG